MISNNQPLITIVTVAASGDEPFVRNNIEYLRAAGVLDKVSFVIIDNSKKSPSDPGITSHFDAEVVPGVLPSLDYPKSCRGSYQHTEALNAYFRSTKINTRFLLVLDPDCYIVRPNWLEDVIAHMLENKLAFFGLPWHPKWYSKYRNFPCVHAMFIDCSQVDVAKQDFTPNLIEKNNKLNKRNQKLAKEDCKKHLENSKKSGFDSTDVSATLLKRYSWYRLLLNMYSISTKSLAEFYRDSGLPIPFFLRVILKFSMFLNKIHLKYVFAKKKLASFKRMLITCTLTRRLIGASDDSGFRIFKKFSRLSDQINLVQPVVNYTKDFHALVHLRFKWGFFLESIMPDRWSFFPKSKDYCSEKSFAHFGMPDFSVYNWEEFVWRGEPFAFHLRRYNKLTRDVSLELKEISSAMRVFFPVKGSLKCSSGVPVQDLSPSHEAFD